MKGLSLRARHGDLPAEVTDVLRRKAERLQRKFEDLQELDVVVDVPHKSQRKGNETEVRITAKLPRQKPVVVHGTDREVVEQGQNVYFAIDQAFETLDLQLTKSKQRRSSRRAAVPVTMLGGF